MKQVVENIESKPSTPILGHVSPSDVECMEEIAGENWNEDCAVYAFHSESLFIIPKQRNIKLSLATLKSEIYTISPIRVFDQNIRFAPLGLLRWSSRSRGLHHGTHRMHNKNQRKRLWPIWVLLEH
ncbi:hypothetical protein SLEP1_g13247 [Rubroshorea leprosula]|uniref:Uncharacterized protein n=1 Tax=Rubroshorea leprosula TaxID=152421 RepID=A0AAV5IRL8_9ROSI|nr:hypothetical protein SLEP1_g13247 [Rubroshorea leprosula]